MKRKLEASELIFRIISYLLLTVFALCCLYPFLYAVSASISGTAYVENGLITKYREPTYAADGAAILDEAKGQTLVWAVPEYEEVTVGETEDGEPITEQRQRTVNGELSWRTVEADTEGAAQMVTWKERAQLILLPKALQFEAFADMFKDNVFWNAYSNTLFLTIFGTAWALLVAIMGAYALSKKRLLFRKFFNFFLVFTMWFSAGIVPQYLNYLQTRTVFHSVGIMDDKWLVVIAMGMAAMNIILLRNAFENVPSEIEEAAIVDGATEMQVLRQVYIPMSKSTIATVALFFAVSRWNGYFWAKQMISNENEKPLQVFIQTQLATLSDTEFTATYDLTHNYAPDSAIYALIVCSIIPILVIYPFIQKYFAKGTNAGGVKE